MVNVRQTMTPVNMNQYTFTGGGTAPIGAVAPTAGCDYAGTNTTFTTWATLPATTGGFTVAGIQFVNNGSQFLWYYNGAAAVNASILIGVKAGGLVQLYSQEQVTLGTTSYGFIGPLSPASFNQLDSSQFSGTGAGGVAPGGIIAGQNAATNGLGLTCIDFSAVTNLAVRLYQCGTVSP
jgi:hypothetical protein